MKQTIFILMTIFLIVSSINANKSKNIIYQTNTRSNYQLIINDVILRFSTGKYVSINELQNAIPMSQEEFWIYYSFSDPEKGELINKSFSKIDLLIIKYAKKNRGLFLKLYLQLSPFVDGEYAEGYYVDVESIIENNKSLFCRIYESLNSDSKAKLKEYKEQYCK
ncbi:hypothetical protein [uncultured Bacteroides sp.]|uniref:hypothetical protein n=1 Tax=uncultured Bacteroides sp. TaxID=162156 RepID=UPI002AAC2713|nr:hypothetical protein [uncultured Bacteroides sp.]